MSHCVLHSDCGACLAGGGGAYKCRCHEKDGGVWWEHLEDIKIKARRRQGLGHRIGPSFLSCRARGKLTSIPADPETENLAGMGLPGINTSIHT